MSPGVGNTLDIGLGVYSNSVRPTYPGLGQDLDDVSLGWNDLEPFEYGIELEWDLGLLWFFHSEWLLGAGDFQFHFDLT